MASEEDLKVANAVVAEHKCGTLYIGKERTRLRESIATALSKTRAEQREKIADKVDDMAAEYERQGDYGTINNFVQRVVAANEISAAIRAGDKDG